ncbi:hypothetical protein MLD38_011877 [Melastoma candidum]|uniref:Uncharacterized protein n=1 Tax=Melastoma candidum TaxID=119954 RepID=A0ACB9R437_9MYRT|nr:hypothetical protein MLD38_011877 [Melastoma candidum]
MWASLRSHKLFSPSNVAPHQWKLGFSRMISQKALLDLQEVEKVLADVRADNVKVVPVENQCGWADYMVVATGRSTWHVRNIAQALVYKVKQKQKGDQNQRLLLPRVEGQEEGKWVIVDSGNVVVHALDEKARAYYNLEGLWAKGAAPKESEQELEKAFMKVRRKNNSKKPAQAGV